MIRRFIGYLRRIQGRPTQKMTRVYTDLTDCVYLHEGDSLCIWPVVEGFGVFAAVLRDGQCQTWPLYNCADLREAYDLRCVLDKHITLGARRCDARASLRRERESQMHAHQEVAF
ncbi:hypothetical protein EON83_20365 [bacterium]|nr:MAG: hypothetical protein EON83_20365 [bacterium]